MKPKLPRALLWKEIDEIDDFFKEPVNSEMYDLIFKLKESTSLLEITGFSAIKFFNEVYYQCTRIVYEENPDIQIRDYIADIKSNMGSYNHATIVMGLIHFLLSHRNNNNMIVTTYSFSFYKRFLMNAGSQVRDLFEYDQPLYDIDLSPRPCSTGDLNQMLVDWEEVTNHFDKESIDCIVKLYDEVTERKKVYSMIEHAYEKFFKKRGKSILNLKAIYPNMADYQFFYDYNEVKAELFPKQSFVCREDEPNGFPTYQELEEENINLKKKLEEALSKIESLKSALNMTKPKKQQEKSFTLSMIVDYCKHKPEYSCVVPIETMLYKLTNKRSENEEKLIDSISEYFNNKKYGNTFNNAKVTMQNPQIQDVYRITGNDTVNLGDQQDGEEGEEDPDEEES